MGAFSNHARELFAAAGRVRHLDGKTRTPDGLAPAEPVLRDLDICEQMIYRIRQFYVPEPPSVLPGGDTDADGQANPPDADEAPATNAADVTDDQGGDDADDADDAAAPA